jgi:ribosomal protein L44E
MLATQAEIRRIAVQSQPRQVVQETLSQENSSQKRAGGVAQDVDSEFKPQYHKKKKKKKKQELPIQCTACSTFSIPGSCPLKASDSSVSSVRQQKTFLQTIPSPTKIPYENSAEGQLQDLWRRSERPRGGREKNPEAAWVSGLVV